MERPATSFEPSLLAYKKTIIVSLLLLATLSIPLTLTLAKVRQTARLRAENAFFECSKEEAEQGVRTQTCTSSETCTGTQYSEYYSCLQKSKDGSCSIYYCQWSACKNPIYCQ